MKTGSERTLEWRKRLVKEGHRQIAVMLSPDAYEKLQALAKRHGDSKTAAIEAAIHCLYAADS